MMDVRNIILKTSSLIKRLLPVLLIFLVGSSLVYARSQATGHISLETLPAISFQGVHSLLVIAPHPDDESLGPAGLIQQALALGIEVNVVVVTNGDGQEIAPPALGMGLPKTADFIAIGERRQQESLSALAKLGVDASHAFYLGYPDRGIKPMWMADWNTQCPYYSSYTRSTSSPYPMTYNNRAVYCGWDLLNDLRAIIAANQPDMIVIPHPEDQHPDHLAVSNFTRMAAALEHIAHPSYQPVILGYLVHYGYFPEPRGLRPTQSLLPPAPLSSAEYSWMRYDLTPQEEITKIAAVYSYSSQIKMMRSFLVSFDRTNELFMKLMMISLAGDGSSSMPAPESTGGGVSYYEPSKETSRLVALPGADIIGWQVDRLGNSLTLTLMTKGKLIDGLQYTIYIKTPDGKTYTYNQSSQGESTGPRSFSIQVNLSDLGNPELIAFSAQTRQDVTLDHSAWEFVLLNRSSSATGSTTP